MIPAGYLLKRITPPPGWLSPAPVVDVCSVSRCVNDDIVDVQSTWRHNGFGVANDWADLLRWASDAGLDFADGQLFYYEAYEHEIQSDGWTFDPTGWRPLTITPSAGVETAVTAPDPARLMTLVGYDVVVFEDYLEHSPLSCNGRAETLQVNRHCLFETFQEAKAAIDNGDFGEGCEPGVYRIFSVNLLSLADVVGGDTPMAPAPATR